MIDWPRSFGGTQDGGISYRDRNSNFLKAFDLNGHFAVGPALREQTLRFSENYRRRENHFSPSSSWRGIERNVDQGLELFMIWINPPRPKK